MENFDAELLLFKRSLAEYMKTNHPNLWEEFKSDVSYPAKKNAELVVRDNTDSYCKQMKERFKEFEQLVYSFNDRYQQEK